jgi:hypothetical protein
MEAWSEERPIGVERELALREKRPERAEPGLDAPPRGSSFPSSSVGMEGGARVRVESLQVRVSACLTVRAGILRPGSLFTSRSGSSPSCPT